MIFDHMSKDMGIESNTYKHFYKFLNSYIWDMIAANHFLIYKAAKCSEIQHYIPSWNNISS